MIAPYIFIFMLGLWVGSLANWLMQRLPGEESRPARSRCLLVKLASGILAAYLFGRFGFSIPFLGFYYFAVCLLVIAFIDLEQALPGLALALIGPAPASPVTSLADSLAGLAFGYGALKIVSLLYKKLRGYDGLGDGDPLLLGLIGIFLGWRSIPFVIFASALIGLLSAGLMVLTAREKPPGGWATKPLPFGPFLVAAAFLYLVVGSEF